jgi:hypothetical protein
VRFRQKIVIELGEHIARLGLRSCPGCDSETLGISPYPVILNFGGFQHEKTDARYDPEANIYYAAKVECHVCGYMMLFNSEQFHHGDEPILFMGTPEHEAEIDPPDEPGT